MNTPFRQPDDVDDFPRKVQLKCEVCDWIDDFEEDTLDCEKCTIGFCEDCGEQRVFTPTP